MNSTGILPLDKTLHYANVFPHIWERLDTVRFMKGVEDFEWEDWCYFPVLNTMAALTSFYKHEDLDESLAYISEIVAAYTWRVNKPIYKFDLTTAEKLLRSADVADMIAPVDAFYKLPYPCVYVQVPEEAWHVTHYQMDGFWAYLEHDKANNICEIRINPLWDEPVNLNVRLEKGKRVFDGVNAALAEGIAEAFGVEPTDPKVLRELRNVREQYPRVHNTLAGCVALLLALLFEQVDVTLTQEARKGSRIKDVASEVEVWTVTRKA